MKIMNLKERKEDAVSPVIGVMLMLVVTIVIAAVVAAFAGGLATETEATPIVVLDADVYETNSKLVLRSLSGDNLNAVSCIDCLTIFNSKRKGEFHARREVFLCCRLNSTLCK